GMGEEVALPAGRRRGEEPQHDVGAAAHGCGKPGRGEADRRRWGVDNKRRRFLEAARNRSRHDGFRKTTMQELARDSCVAVGTLYLYLKDKNDLLVGGTEEYVTRHRRQAESRHTPPGLRIARPRFLSDGVLAQRE